MQGTIQRICKSPDGITAQDLALFVLSFQILLHILPVYARPLPTNSLDLDQKPGPIEDVHFSGPVKSIQTVLAIISAAALTATYGLLIHAGNRLTRVSKLPLKAIETNLSRLLSATWPDSSSTLGCVGNVNTIRLFWVGRSGQPDELQQRKARGIEDCPLPPPTAIKQPPLWLTSSSPLTRNVVQLAIWESIIVWLCLIMVIATLLYNGFFSSTRGTDAYPRLVVVLIYIMAYIVHLAFVWRHLKRFFTLVAGGAAWSMLHRARFSVVDYGELQRHLNQHSNFLHFKEIEKANTSVTSGTYNARLAHEQSTQESGSQSDAEKIKALREAVATLDDVAKTERNHITTKSNEALARITANAITASSIIISYGFAVWTSRLESAGTSTLGSLALLASLSIGVGSMYTSAVDLSLLNAGFETISWLKEIKINGLAIDHINKQKWTNNAVGFILGARKSNIALRPLSSGLGTVFCPPKGI